MKNAWGESGRNGKNYFDIHPFSRFFSRIFLNGITMRF